MIYKYFLSLYFLTVLFFLTYFYYGNLGIRQNYLYMGQSTLEKHEIFYADSSINKIIFLGSSAVAGSNIPQYTTTSDFLNKLLTKHKAYNLAVHESTTIESLLLLKMIEKKNPKIVIMGIDPGSFPVSIPGKNLVWNNMSLLDEYLTNDEKLKIKRDKLKKTDLEQLLGLTKFQILPTKHHIYIQTELAKLRYLMFGNVFNTKIIGNRGQSAASAFNTDTMYYRALGNIKDLTEKNGFQFYVYLEPIYNAEQVYGKDGFNKYLKTVTKYLNNLNVPFFDYTNLNPSTHDYFYDFIHMTPEGNNRVAKKLYQDIGGTL